MKRISVTAIEKFRRFMTSESDFDTEAALLETLKGTFTGNPKTVVGGAFHKIIEGEFTELHDGCIQACGIIFTPEQAEPALTYRNEHSLMIHEMNVNAIYETKYFPIQVTGRVDGIEGTWIRDAKLKFRSPGDFKDYEQSCQWKFYCDSMETGEFFYDLFEAKGFDDAFINGNIVPPAVCIQAHEPFPCVATHDLRPELTTLLNDFLDYLKFRNIVHLLKPATINLQY